MQLFSLVSKTAKEIEYVSDDCWAKGIIKRNLLLFFFKEHKMNIYFKTFLWYWHLMTMCNHLKNKDCIASFIDMWFSSCKIWQRIFSFQEQKIMYLHWHDAHFIVQNKIMHKTIWFVKETWDSASEAYKSKLVSHLRQLVKINRRTRLAVRNRLLLPVGPPLVWNWDPTASFLTKTTSMYTP